ncbi:MULTISPECIES: ACT domain-containing protein [Protofrankia]|uniref:Amino acid-binding ACT domain protein n=1 Tax=Candidatus Protofrankia datiscae TaxID=2716812 RepID=F8B528_9ACTN|nr:MULTISPECIES: ACT domain-containing protein [Protofrankia]AEH11050.1 amino acid-binding ACT domain protein [Candidatus Protofrankia datiscae]
MSYLLRLVLPDRPGALGAVATALGQAGIDIVSLSVVERGARGAVDDLVVELPPNGLADTVLTAACSVPGVSVESLRPYPAGGVGIRDDLDLVEALTARPDDALAVLTGFVGAVFHADWAVLLERVAPGDIRIVESSVGAPDLGGDELTSPKKVRTELLSLPLDRARGLGADSGWFPPRWSALGMELAVAPVGTPPGGSSELAVLVGRPGGPRFRASEVQRLAHLAGIAATIVRNRHASPAPT